MAATSPPKWTAKYFRRRDDAQPRFTKLRQWCEQGTRGVRWKEPAITFNNRGIAYSEKGQHDRAIQDYDQAIKLNPNNAAALYNRSVAKDKKSDKARAEADLAAARRIDPKIGR
jgi:tetratricopeptide (TPR) repeat protein